MANDKIKVTQGPGFQNKLAGAITDTPATDPNRPIRPKGLEQSLTDRISDALKPAPPPANQATGKFSNTGPVWWLSLDNDQTHLAESLAATAGAAAFAFIPPPFGLAVSGAIEASIPYIEAINKFGGYNGVEINGVVGTLGVIVTPRVGGVYGDLIQAARLSVSGRTIIDFVVMASSKVPQLAAALEIPVVASIFGAVASGTPVGAAIAAALGFFVDKAGPVPDINAHGSVLANRDQAKEWESFLMAQIGQGNQVGLLSWQGLFSAQGGGGAGVYANRPELKEWETWTLIDNNDGTVSFQTINGHFLCAEEGGGRECQANRTAIGNWEKFYIVNLPNGKIALKTHDKGKFVSVQKDS
jgi:hypothetical protein